MLDKFIIFCISIIITTLLICAWYDTYIPQSGIITEKIILNKEYILKVKKIGKEGLVVVNKEIYEELKIGERYPKKTQKQNDDDFYWFNPTNPISPINPINFK